MSTDFNSVIDTTITSENKLNLSTGRVARFSYEDQALTEDHVAGTESYDYNQDNNIPLPDDLQMSATILSKGLRSQASSFTRMAVNHFFGRTSYNVNKLAEHLKNFLTYFKNFLNEGDNLWTATSTYKTGDVVYFLSSLNGGTAKRTFACLQENTNLPPVDSATGALINTAYWNEIGNNFPAIKATSATVNGTLTVNGDIIQNGSAYETHAEKLYTKKDTIITRDGAVSGLATGEYSGVQVNKYDGTHSCGLVVDNSGTARVGEYEPDSSVDDTQPLLTRCEVNDASLANGAPLIWDAQNKRAIGGSFASSPIITANSTTFTGVAISAGFTIKVQFTADISGTDGSTPLAFTYNNSASPIPVKVAKDGALVDVCAKEVQTNIFKYLQAYTTLELLYDGTNFIVLGNPIVLSSSDYVIYADGFYKWLKFDTTERWSGEYFTDGKPIYKRVYYSATNWSNGQVVDTINDVETSVSLHSTSKYNTNSSYYCNYDVNSHYHVPRYSTSDNKLIVDVAGQFVNTEPSLIEFEYTKTTDTAGTIPSF